MAALRTMHHRFRNVIGLMLLVGIPSLNLRAAEQFKLIAGGRDHTGPALTVNLDLSGFLGAGADGTLYGCCVGATGNERFSFSVSPSGALSSFDGLATIFGPDGQIYGLGLDDQRQQILVRIDPKTGRQTVVANNSLVAACGQVRAIDQQGRVYCTTETVPASDYALHRLDTSTGAVSSVSGPSHSCGGNATKSGWSQIRAIAIDNSGGVLIANCSGYSLQRLNPALNSTSTIKSCADIATGSQCTAIVASDQYAYVVSRSIVWRVEISTGNIKKIAGTESPGFNGDGLAVNAQLNSPVALAVGTKNDLFIADAGNHRIRRVDLNSGLITSVAGNGTQSFFGDGVPAVNAAIGSVQALAIDSSGNVYVADAVNSRIRKIEVATGLISTVAGNGLASWSGDGGPATKASINGPVDLAFDDTGKLYIADMLNCRVRRVDTSGAITTVAGNGTVSISGDNTIATNVGIGRPSGITIDAGYLFIADFDTGSLAQVELSSGRLKWLEHGLGTPNELSRLSSFGRRVLLAHQNGCYWVFDVSDNSTGMDGCLHSSYIGIGNDWRQISFNSNTPPPMQSGTCSGSDFGILSGACQFGGFAVDSQGDIIFSTGQFIGEINGRSSVVSDVAGGGLWADDTNFSPGSIALSSNDELYVGTNRNGINVVVTGHLSLR